MAPRSSPGSSAGPTGSPGPNATTTHVGPGSAPATSPLLDGTFHALSDPTRRSLLTALVTGGPQPVGALAEPLPISQPAVTKHLHVLAAAGLIRREKRGRQTICHVEVTPMAEAAAWIARMKDHWDAALDQLEAVLDEQAAAAPPPRTPEED